MYCAVRHVSGADFATKRFAPAAPACIPPSRGSGDNENNAPENQ
jgi:hypothetical protein